MQWPPRKEGKKERKKKEKKGGGEVRGYSPLLWEIIFFFNETFPVIIIST